nr:hydrocephalus inducing protein [Hymenolepis microstoma]
MSLFSRLLSTLKPLTFQPQNLRHFRTSVVNATEDIYKVLGVKQNATQREIKEAFYNLSKKYHPDITGNSASSAQFQKIKNAYEILGDSSKRADYDRGLVPPKASSSSTEFPSKEDMDVLKKYDSGSFEANYVRAYNRNLNVAWTNHADEKLAKSAFDYRIDQRKFACVIYFAVLGFIFGSYSIAKYYEEPVKYLDTSNS